MHWMCSEWAFLMSLRPSSQPLLSTPTTDYFAEENEHNCDEKWTENESTLLCVANNSDNNANISDITEYEWLNQTIRKDYHLWDEIWRLLPLSSYAVVV